MSQVTNAPAIGHISYEMHMFLCLHRLLCSIYDTEEK